VAGTNGKGSTTHAIATVLARAGMKTGSYFSPYVFDVSERWRMNGTAIEHSELLDIVDNIRPAVEGAETALGARLSEFELKTAIAFYWFDREEVDVAVMEVGIGGRLDATNIIPPPLVAVITSIGLDHVRILGETRSEIAAEKAGILKTGTLACVTPVIDREAGPVIARMAERHRIPLVAVANPANSGHGGVEAPFTRLNKATARETLLVLRTRAAFDIPDSALEQGLAAAHLPGRFQAIEIGDRTLLLDVAHNEQGASALGEGLERVYPGRPVVAVVGLSANHDPEELLSRLAHRLTKIIATEPDFRPAPAETVAAAAGRMGLASTTVVPVADAVATAWRSTPPGGVCLVTGSFFVVGSIPRELDGTPLR